jgi:hypothetical protein
VNVDLSSAFDQIADDAARQADLGPVDRIVQRRRRRRTVRRTVVGAGALAVVGGLALAGTSLAAWRAPEPQPAVTGPAPTPTATPGPDGAMPLKDPFVPRWDGTTAVSSDMPGPGHEAEDAVLADGDYFLGSVLAVDLDARTLHVSINGFWGDADGQGGSDDAMRSHTLPVAEDVVVTGFCQDPEGVLTQRALTLETLQEAPGPDCDGPEPETVERTAFWADVRGGLVRQIVGQGWPRTAGDGGTSPAGTMPLRDPFAQRIGNDTSSVSAIPTEEALGDGDYFGSITSADPVARTVTVDIMAIYTGSYADDWLRNNEPDEFTQTGAALNNYVLVNDMERLRTLPVAPDAAITGYCLGSAPLISQRAQTLETVLDTPGPGCSGQEPELDDPGRSTFWVDVRGGIVRQLVGQYLP